MPCHFRLFGLFWVGMILLLVSCTAQSRQAVTSTEITPAIYPSSTLTLVTPPISTSSPTLFSTTAPAATQGPVASVTATMVETPPGGGAGEIVFSSNRSGDYAALYEMDLYGSDLTLLARSDSNLFAGPWSSDGRQILFTGFGLTHSYVGVMNADGSQAHDLSQRPDSDDGFPAWSPDGAEIAFTSRRDGNNEIYIMKADGSTPRRLTNNPADDFAPSWSPDGMQIAFVSDRNHATGVNNLYIMNVDGSHLRRLTKGAEIDHSPAWSPDGSWIAFRADHGGPGDIYLIRPDGTGLVNLTDNSAEDWSPDWSPDSTLLAFQTNRDGNWEIYIIRVDGSDPQNLTKNPADDQLPFWKPSSGTPSIASDYCTNQWGIFAVENRGDVNSFGVCYFEDNRQCEVWTLLRGGCPVGGLKITGYITEAARFCAITGGKYAITGNSGADNEQGTCSFSNGNTCDVWEYYFGKCSQGG